MFGNQDNQLPMCDDIAVDKHKYHVSATFTDNGEILMEEAIEAGSVAHAAMLFGMLLFASNAVALLTNEEFFQNFAHNLGEHVNVDVTLIG